jgi:hypothetical protein
MLTMQIRTQGVHLKGVLPRLDHWAHRVVTRDCCPALAALVRPVQNIFPHCTLFLFIREGSRAASLFS